MTRFDLKVVWRLRSGALYLLLPEPAVPEELRHHCSRTMPPETLAALTRLVAAYEAHRKA